VVVLGKDGPEIVYVVTDVDERMLPATAVMLHRGVWVVKCDLSTAQAIIHDARALGHRAEMADEYETARTLAVSMRFGGPPLG
jgi:hypothetical protein